MTWRSWQSSYLAGVLMELVEFLAVLLMESVRILLWTPRAVLKWTARK